MKQMALALSILPLAGCQEMETWGDQVSRNARAKLCEYSDNHLQASRPTDLGNGIVAQSSGGSTPLGEYSGWEATSCDAGRQLAVVFKETDYVSGPDGLTGENKIVAYRKDATEAFLAGAHRIEAATLDQFEDLATRHGLVTRTKVDSSETCGCAVFYPELLGDKQPASQRADMPAWSEI